MVINTETGMVSLPQLESPEVLGETGSASPIRHLYAQGEDFIFSLFFADRHLEGPPPLCTLTVRGLPSTGV